MNILTDAQIWKTLPITHKHKKVCEDFEIKKLGVYHDWYLQSNALLLTDVFENCPNMCYKI